MGRPSRPQVGIRQSGCGGGQRSTDSHAAGDQGIVTSIAWSPDGKTLASAGYDYTIRLWQPASGQPIRTLEGDHGIVTSVAWSPDGKTLASGSNDKTIRLWEHPAANRFARSKAI